MPSCNGNSVVVSKILPRLYGDGAEVIWVKVLDASAPCAFGNVFFRHRDLF